MMDIEKGSRAATRLVPWEKEVTLIRIGANHSDTARCSRPYRHHTPACDENGLEKFRELEGLAKTELQIVATCSPS